VTPGERVKHANDANDIKWLQKIKHSNAHTHTHFELKPEGEKLQKKFKWHQMVVHKEGLSSTHTQTHTGMWPQKKKKKTSESTRLISDE